jgi:cold shock CspA family protein
MEEDAPGARAATDRFYHGKIDKLFPGNQTGLILSETGRELLFESAHVRIVGPIRDFEALQEGMEVGFDVGRTSKGLRVTMIRTGEDAGRPEPGTQASGSTDQNPGSPNED